MVNIGDIQLQGDLTPSQTPSFVGFYARRNATLSCPDNTVTWADPQQELYDIGGYYDTGTGRFTPLVAGYYYTWGAARVDDPGALIEDGRMFVAITKNGSGTLGEFSTIVGPSRVNMDFDCAAMPGVYYMNGTTDYLRMYYYANSFGAQTLTVNSAPTSGFGAYLIGT